jgi:hypothetical protein
MKSDDVLNMNNLQFEMEDKILWLLKIIVAIVLAIVFNCNVSISYIPSQIINTHTIMAKQP